MEDNQNQVSASLLAQIERALEADGRLSPDLQDTIRTHNRKILAYSSDQIIPISRPFGGRWFDGFTLPSSLIQQLAN